MSTDGPSARERSPFGAFQMRPSHLKTGPCPYPPGSAGAIAWRRAQRQPHMGVPGQIMRQIAGIGAIDPVPPDVAHNAALTCAEAATDRDDLRVLLDALGLGVA